MNERLSERLHGLRWRWTAMKRLWGGGAQPHMTFLEPERVPSEPIGEVELPEPEAILGRAFDIEGWVLFPSGPAARVELTLGGRPLGRARLAIARHDIRAAWESPHAPLSGFALRASLDQWGGEAGQTELVAVATSLAGERLELPSVSVEVVAEPQPDTSLPELPRRTPPAPPPPPGKPRVLVVTHQLGLGGAQLYLLDLISEMVASGRAGFTVVSSHDGALRPQLEALGIPVHVSGVTSWEDFSRHVGAVEELVSWISEREFDAALVNTTTALSIPGAEAAEQLGLPVVWAIHESYDQAELFTDFDSRVRERALAALRGASALVFEADATKRLYEPLAGPARCVTLPYGLDLGPIEAEREQLDPAAARAAAGIAEDAELIVCVGTIEPRKAQAMLTQAFEAIAARHPRARLALVGGNSQVDSTTLDEYLAVSPLRDRIDLIPVTPDVQRWYAMADVFVCASDIESLPRTVLEAMAWETPVLATEVFGLPELIVDGENGWLCEPRDLDSLIAALERALATPAEERRRLGRNGRALVEERHSLARYGEQIGTLIERAVAGGGPGDVKTAAE